MRSSSCVADKVAVGVLHGGELGEVGGAVELVGGDEVIWRIPVICYAGIESVTSIAPVTVTGVGRRRRVGTLVDANVSVRSVTTIAVIIPISDVPNQITRADIAASTDLQPGVRHTTVSVGFREHMTDENSDTFATRIALKNHGPTVAVVELGFLDDASTGSVNRSTDHVSTRRTVGSEVIVAVATTPVVVAVGDPAIERPLEVRRDVVGAGRSS
ncbi:MAG: hypothetical protein A3B74_01285 [Candidatus Kerfeldbacteria bacterium RIFCSPHIGHO2_02_FULL_42_14]|uniref:Uncharacterized protein n=1 Tax=Candidatus Kerfeldbacteria bacterium RIFCSPHIGHO2_02_FULL_42_14 TaxID=1798540 RepID=A0A1G2AN90_9BACT|nr:MAG: hypothetical protein A3B74_01285 [Candidatus Kerfeldbacteria bacterium RIFCSPHIGHO2_02_FULL_42_14]OGY81137.1 MAG: hypothetical protein A3E60_04750 [Candidatus Kerfeldbacteria bacterium RIFCSPHIGHO2_12_FULL_42_13]OGY84217.1 MAG: hypothetical protein A3I91_05475 [Candidatus Kerfeldbacteria bacterium RIFCSPLOWO2_02_FULL_42_19]